MHTAKKILIAAVVEIHSLGFLISITSRNFYLITCLFAILTFIATLFVIDWIEEQFDKLKSSED